MTPDLTKNSYLEPLVKIWVYLWMCLHPGVVVLSFLGNGQWSGLGPEQVVHSDNTRRVHAEDDVLWVSIYKQVYAKIRCKVMWDGTWLAEGEGQRPDTPMAFRLDEKWSKWILSMVQSMSGLGTFCRPWTWTCTRAHHELTRKLIQIRPAGILLVEIQIRICADKFTWVTCLNRSGTCRITDHPQITDICRYPQVSTNTC